MGRAAVRHRFPEACLAAVERAIRASEARHTGEICFAVEAALDTLPLVRGQSARDRAVEVFSHLRIWDTEHDNGVLIYLLLADRDVEIIADRGIAAHVGSGEWERICREMEHAFGQGRYGPGVIAGIDAVDRHLRAHFGVEGDCRENGNVVPDAPVIL